MPDPDSSISTRKPPVLLPGLERPVQMDPQSDGGVIVTISTDRSLPIYIGRFASPKLFGGALIPFALVLYWLFATRRPRAVVLLSPTEFAISETDDEGLGIRVRRRSWRFDEIGELRPNRFDASLYLTIRGKNSFDLLGELPPPVIAAVAAALAEARERINSRLTHTVEESQ